MAGTFLEQFVLTENRLKLVEQTYDQDNEDFWFYSLLTLQTKLGTTDDPQLSTWIQKAKDSEFANGPKVQRILFRQAVKDFSQATSKETAEKIREVVQPNLDFKADTEVDGVAEAGREFQSTLQLNTKKLLSLAFDQAGKDGSALDSIFTPQAAEFITGKNLSPEQIGSLLTLIQNEPPEIPYLLTLIKRDLKDSPFGSRGVHTKLTRQQLELLGTKSPELLADETYLQTYCRKLRPVVDVNVQNDRKVLGKYIASLRDFALKKIKNDAHASMKALILYNAMIYQEQDSGEYDRALVKAYLALPKQKSKWAAQCAKGRTAKSNLKSVNFQYEVPDVPELKPIVNDEAFVQRALIYFFRKGEKASPWSEVEQSQAMPLWAETMLVEGRGNEKFRTAQTECVNKFYGAGYDKTLTERVDLELRPNNTRQLGVDAAVRLQLITKNNPEITVNVYEMNPRNYYLRKMQLVPADINLKGSLPIATFTNRYDEEKILRKYIEIEVPQLTGRRGLFAIDLIGNGQSARAFIRKGELRYLAEQTPAGYVFRVFNESNTEVTTGRITMEGVAYDADEKGEITLPFGDEVNDNQMIIVEDRTDPGSATLLAFERLTRNFKLDSGIYIDRESLLTKKQAKVIIRTNLYLNEEAVSVAHLSNVEFRLTTTNAQQEQQTRVARNIFLYDDKETEYAFTVPTELREVRVSLTAYVGDVKLDNTEVFRVNGIDSTPHIGDIFLFPSGAAGYVLSVQGKNGEPMPNRIINMELKHRYFQQPLKRTVQSDANGRIYLGRLPDVLAVKAEAQDRLIYPMQEWNLLQDKINVPRYVNAVGGPESNVRIPYTSATKNGPRVYVFDVDFIVNYSKQCSYKKGYIEIKGLPAGDFTVFIREMVDSVVTVSVSEGPTISNRLGTFLLSDARVLQLSDQAPLQIIAVKGNRDRGFKVQLEGENSRTRVHVVATANIPRYTMYSFLAAPHHDPDHFEFEHPLSDFLPQQPIDAEYKYVLDRKNAEKNMGNLLQRPSNLMGRWSAAPVPTPDAGGDNGQKPQQAGRRFTRKYARSLKRPDAASVKRFEDSSSLEFLAESSKVYANVEVEEGGVVQIPSSMISEQHSLLQILAVDDDNTALRNIILDESPAEQKLNDVRLSPGLDPKQHFCEIRSVVPLPNDGDEYAVADFNTAEVEPFESLSEAFFLLRALAGKKSKDMKNALSKFRPLVEWHTLTKDQRLEFYDGAKCHEANLFLYLKDKEFFDEVIAPTIQGKMFKTFMDQYLLGDKNITGHLDFAKYNALNALEKILLASRAKDQALTDATLRSFQEAADLIQVDPRETDKIFHLAHQSRQLSLDLLDSRHGGAIDEKGDIPDLDEEKSAAAVGAPLAVQESVAGIVRSAGSAGAMSLTRSFEEGGYYRVPWSEQNQNLIKMTKFWNDYAKFVLTDGQPKAFLSSNFPTTTSNVNEMLLCLAVLDLPLDAKEIVPTYTSERSVKFMAHQPAIVFARELKPTEYRTSSISVSVNCFNPECPMEMVDGQQVDKFIDRDFQTATVYGCRTVITNVSSVIQNVELLTEIPTGAIPTRDGFRTRNWLVPLQPFGTEVREFFFYFPAAGTFQHFPVHVAKNGRCVGYGLESKTLKVTVGEPPADRSSWDYISQKAAAPEVLDFIANSPQAVNVDLSRIAWRLSEPKFFDDLTRILKQRQIYDDRVWAYAITSDKGGKEMGEFLSTNRNFLDYAGPELACDLVTIDSSANRDADQTEFGPLVNARAHKSVIASSEFNAKYDSFLQSVAYTSHARSNISVSQKMTLVQFLLAQNRVEEAQALFNDTDPKAAKAVSELAYDYLDCFLKLYAGDAKSLKEARRCAEGYLKKPLPASQQKLFRSVVDVCEEVGKPAMGDGLFDAEAEKKRQEADQPQLDFETLTDHRIRVSYQNIEAITLTYFQYDIESYFSSAPFQEENVAFTFVTPNETQNRKLPATQATADLAIPDAMRNQNMIIKIEGGGLTVAKPDFDNNLTVQVAVEEGEIRVLQANNKNAIAKAYVKVYGRLYSTGETVFYKDGYTDVRGRFDIRSLSTEQEVRTRRLAVLVTTAEHGSTILEVDGSTGQISRARASRFVKSRDAAAVWK